MAGYVVELYKNIRSADGYQPRQKQEDDDKEKQEKFHKKTYVTFGEFDKMAISRVTAFSRMRDMSELSKMWIGDRQKLLLYEIEQDNEVFYRDAEGSEGIYIKADKGIYLSESLFIAVTILQFKEEEDKTDTKQRLKIYRDKILSLVKKKRTEEKEEIYCSVFGTLGTYGFAVMWAADQPSEILKLINEIKGMSAGDNEECDTNEAEHNFLSLFSIFAKNNLEKEAIRERLDCVRGTALLQVTLESALTDVVLSRFGKQFMTEEFLHSAGEHDLIIKTSIKSLYWLFEEKELLDPGEPFYQKHILQTNVRLCDELSVETDWESSMEEEQSGKAKEEKEDYQEQPNRLSEIVKKVKENYKELRKMFFEDFPKTAGMVDSLDLLYSDFVSKISTVSNSMWAYDFGYQFLAILNVIKKYLEKFIAQKIIVPTTQLLEEFREILNCFEYQIIHIAESNNLLIDTPNCHLRYTGQNNLTLYSYFGITKDVIKLCYLMSGKKQQSQIMPLISVDIVPIIESTMYIDYGVSGEDRVINFNLPMMALYNMPEYVPYLYHEIFHYTVPRDRVVRNWIKGIGLTIAAVQNVFRNLFGFYSGIEEENILEKLTRGVFLPAIYRSVCTRYYDKDMAEIKSKNSKGCGNGDIDRKEWKRYERELFEQLKKDASEQHVVVSRNNIIFDVLVDLYNQREELKEAAENLMERAVDEIKDTEIPVILEKIDEFMNELSGMSGEVGNRAKAPVYNKLIGETKLSDESLLHIQELGDMSTALSEVASDIPMVELAGMEPVHYMISYVKIQDGLLKRSNDKPQIQDYIRIGAVLDYLLGFNQRSSYVIQQFDVCEAPFVQIYTGLYYSNKRAGNNPKAFLKELEEKAKCRFCWIRKVYLHYLKEYRIYSPIFEEIINQASVEKRTKDAAKSEKCQDIYDRILKLHCEKYYTLLQTYGTGIMKAIEAAPTYRPEEARTEILKCKEMFNNNLFELNIRWIQEYQKQESFSDLEKCLKDQAEEKQVYEEREIELIKSFRGDVGMAEWETVLKRKGAENYSYEVDDGIEGLCRVTERILQRFSRQNTETYGSVSHELWYRGQGRTSYRLLPSAMRRYAQQNHRSDQLRTYQREAYEEFKFRMDNMSEKQDRIGYTTCDYLALMQHYSAPTIYMDWSENALAALYFALEAYIDPTKLDEQNNDDAALYVLHPNLYNEARNRIMGLKKADTGIFLDKCMKETEQTSTNSLPNLSVKYNEDKYNMFLLGEIGENDSIPAYCGREIKTLQDNFNQEKYLYLPLAIYSSRANARIRAQFGMFMAFNIFTPIGENGNFDYMSLEKIQEFFLDYFNDAEPFMYKVIIKSNCKKKIAGWLKAIGVSKDMIYPELSNIGERIKRTSLHI